MSKTEAHLSREDDEYIRSRFVNLEEIARRSEVPLAVISGWQREGLFPQPTYVTEDSQEWYPPAYAELVRRATARKMTLRSLFEMDFKRALERLRRSDPAEYRAELTGPEGTEISPEADTELSWQGFLSGEFGACLRVAWVPCMLRKAKLMRTIAELAGKPALDDPSWRIRLRRSVDSLDHLELPFTQWDRVRFGRPVSRDTHVQAIRLRFPEVFGSEAVPRGTLSPVSETLPREELPC
jgi:hypothetical protein